jgi:acetylornithine/LysW-gamma-L-lysine aminotransferase
VSTTAAPPRDHARAVEDRHGGTLMTRRPLRSLRSGSGCWLEDDRGERVLDLTSGYGVAPLGHCHPRLVAAIAAQAARLASCPGNLYCEARARFLERLHGVLPEHLSRSFLCNSGAEAVEAAVKLAIAATGRRGLVALRGAFHGRTLGALALTWNPQARAPFERCLVPVEFVPPGDVGALERAVSDDTAAVVVEVVQGESGVRPVESAFLHAAQSLARRCGALLLVDEVQTGFGRTGAWFAHAELGLEPDLVALAKGIAGGFPMGAAVYTAGVAERLDAGVHASTFGGNPLACAAGAATIEALAAEDLPARAARLGAATLEALRRELLGRTRVREVRGRGLMIGVELREKAGPVLAELLSRHRILALPAGATVLRLLPPLVVRPDELDAAVAALGEVLR